MSTNTFTAIKPDPQRHPLLTRLATVKVSTLEDLEGRLRRPLGRSREAVERVAEVAVGRGLSGDLLSIGWHGDGLLWHAPDHAAMWEAAAAVLGDLPGVVDLALSADARLHAHATLAAEVMPRVHAYFRERLAAGDDPRALRLSGRRLRDLLEPGQWQPGMYVAFVYDLKGHAAYTRAAPRTECAKTSGHRRHVTDLDVMDAAEYLLTMRAANGGRVPRATRQFNVPHRTAEERAQLHARRAARAEERARRRLTRQWAERRAHRRDRRADHHRAAQARRAAVLRFRAAHAAPVRPITPVAGVMPHPVPRRPLHGDSVRPVGHARPPPR